GGVSRTNSLTVADGALVVVDGLFSVSGGSEDSNFLRLDGGYLAWFGNRATELSQLLETGSIQAWDGESWIDADGSSLFDFGYFVNNEDAFAFTGYEGLGGYTILTAAAVPEPSAFATLAGCGALVVALSLRRASGRSVTQT
ncbi:MAG: hypothetical protein ABII82_03600, partial [Verrucomicrobiota bacterium]